VFKNCSGKYYRCGLHFSGSVNVVTRNIFSRLKPKWIHIYVSDLTSFVTHMLTNIFILKSNDGINFFIFQCGNSSVYRDCFREMYYWEFAVREDLLRLQDLLNGNLLGWNNETWNCRCQKIIRFNMRWWNAFACIEA